MNTRYFLLLTLLLTASAAAQRQGEGSSAGRAEKEGREAALPVTPNRTLPKVNPPKTGLEFSASPTTHEIFRARVFEEPLVPIGGEPRAEENAALVAALFGYSKRSGPDDFASLTGFLGTHPQTPWRAALLTDLGLEYYNTAHYSLALDAWEKAWPLAKDATDGKGKAIADRAVGELASLYARLGRMAELDALLNSVEGRGFVGAATEKITGARAGLWNMQNKPETSFKCGPYALQRILASDPSLLPSAATNARTEIANAVSTQKGLSLPQVAELSKRVGLNYQMAFRLNGAGSSSVAEDSARPDKSKFQIPNSKIDFVVPSVVHWKVGHYAAMVRQEGDRYLLEDPTFGNTVWATRHALEAESSGYFLIPQGDLPPGWRSVDWKEGETVWGKGEPPDQDHDRNDCDDEQTQTCPSSDDCPGMAAAGVHLLLVNLNIRDTPVGYSPPVGPPVKFTVRYNHREARQPANFTYSNFGPKWTGDWISYITDNPSNTLSDVNYFVMGGGTRKFNGFNPGTQTFAFQQYSSARLTRTGPASYEMTSPDGSRKIFSQSDGSIGTSRKVFLTQMLDPFGNALTLTYDVNLRLVGITDAIGQVTTLTYGNVNDIYKITRVTDPFGRFANFAYDSQGRLTNIIDVIGLNSTFVYTGSSDFINSLITPYGTTTFIAVQGGGPHDTTRSLETVYPDGSRERVEYNQSANLGIPTNDPPATLPAGMATHNLFLNGRNTYYWSRTACATGYGDYTKAKIYHWLHAENIGVASGILESTKEALENRVWYNYPGQTGIVGSGGVGTSSQPIKVGRVLDDGPTQLNTYAHDGFGHVTNSIDPVGRTFSHVYAANGIDLLEVRQTRAGNNELLSRMTYNAQHLPLTTVDAAGQTNTFTYNARGQLLTETNPKGETTAYTYNTNGYLIAMDGPLPGTNDVVTATFDALGRTLTKTDVSGHTLTFEHDDMDRLTKITYPDSSFEQFTYDRLDMAIAKDRAGRQTLFEFDNVRQMKKRTDPLGRVTLFDWCRCGAIKSLTDPMGRTTSWITDVQGRNIAKQYGDGSQVKYLYENASSRVRQVIDEKQQITVYTYNLDDTLKSVAYANTTVPTSGVNFTYDPNYERRMSMTDGTGTTLYSYNPVTTTPTLGANQLASMDGPLPNDTITYAYNELGRRVTTAINGVASSMAFDAAGRVVSETNALGSFAYAYDGSSGRMLTKTLPNGQVEERSYGNNLQDRTLQRFTHRLGATLVSEFLYGRDLHAERINTWSQQAGAQSPSLHTFGYDSANQLLSASVTNAGSLVKTFTYAYDLLGNRLVEQVGATNYTATYNALNQLSISTAPGASRTNEWDAADRLIAVNAGNQRTEFTYDGTDRMVSIRQLTNGSVASFRRFVWCDNDICEERDAVGVVTKRFLGQGMKLETGPNAGNYFYTRDHLGSIRELTDTSGTVRARYAYDPYGRRTRMAGDLEADFGFAGMFWSAEANLSLTHFRAYDPELGRWLSRDPLPNAELEQGANLYAYVGGNPVNAVDRLGLCCEAELAALEALEKVANQKCFAAWELVWVTCSLLYKTDPKSADAMCSLVQAGAGAKCNAASEEVRQSATSKAYYQCIVKPCEPPVCKPPCFYNPITRQVECRLKAN